LVLKGGEGRVGKKERESVWGRERILHTVYYIGDRRLCK